jgi:predicted ABC-type ATPase
VKPNVYIIAGPNGVGKTTFAREFLPHFADCKNFINADLIAAGVSPFSPDAAAFRAGRLFLIEIDRAIERGDDFAFETTLSGRHHLKLIRNLRSHGYAVHFFFLWLRNAELALERVKDRVLKGGHNVPETVVRRRFDRSLKNFLTNSRALADSWTLFENSGDMPMILSSASGGKLSIIRVQEYETLIARYGE